MRVQIEINKGSINKYEIKDNKLLLDRVLTLAYPANYGYVPETLAEDNDPVDVFVISNDPILPTTYVEIEVHGMIQMVDNGEIDNKVIATVKGDNFQFINLYLADIKSFLKNYKSGVELGEYISKDLTLDYIERKRIWSAPQD